MTTEPASPANTPSSTEVAAIEASFANQALYRGSLLHILNLCAAERDRAQVEASVASLPEMAAAPRSAASLIDSLVRAGALAATVEADGTRMAPEQYRSSLEPKTNPDTGEPQQPATYSQVTFLLATTPAGLEVALSNAPSSRFKQLQNTYPELADTFEDILDFCLEPRTFAQIRTHLQTLGHATAPNKEGVGVVAPSFVLENLHLTGVIAWREGWETTEAGREALLGPNE